MSSLSNFEFMTPTEQLTVKELIEKLKTFDQDKKVVLVAVEKTYREDESPLRFNKVSSLSLAVIEGNFGKAGIEETPQGEGKFVFLFGTNDQPPLSVRKTTT